MTSFACRFMWNSQNQPIFLHDSGGTAHCLNISKKCPTIQLCQHFEKCENKHSSLRLDFEEETFLSHFQTLCCIVSSSKKIFCKVFFGSCQGSSKAYGNRSEKYLQKWLRSQRKIENEKKMAFFCNGT